MVGKDFLLSITNIPLLSTNHLAPCAMQDGPVSAFSFGSGIVVDFVLGGNTLSNGSIDNMILSIPTSSLHVKGFSVQCSFECDEHRL